MKKIKKLLYRPAEIVLKVIPLSWKSYCVHRVKQLLKGQGNTSEQELERQTEDFLRKEITITFWGVVVLMVLCTIIFFSRYFLSDDRIYERNSFGYGEKEIPLVLERDGKIKEYSLKLEEQRLSAEELNELYSDFFEKLESNLRGRNASLKEVTTSLQFDESLEGYPFEITYEPENSDYIQWDGQLGTAWGHMSSEEVIDTEILVTAEHGAYSRSRIYEIRLKGKKKDGRKTAFQKAIDALQDKEEKTRDNKSFRLPTICNEVNIQMAEKKTSVLGYFLLGMFLLLLFSVHKFLELREEEKRCRKEVLQDFPVIVHLLTLYMGAGLSFASSVRRISEDYQKRQRNKKRKYAFEEIMRMDQLMRMGVSQKEASVFWGKQFQETIYQKLSLTLIQTISKGTREARTLMENTEKNAFLQRVDRVRKEGEEAATKLLFPMIVLLCLVMVLIMYPALMRFQGF